MHQIVVVEDEPGIRDVLRVLLSTAHYRVVAAENATRGEVEARAHKPPRIRRSRHWTPVRTTT
jgi:DNA-binding response OmpR family regulator